MWQAKENKVARASDLGKRIGFDLEAHVHGKGWGEMADWDGFLLSCREKGNADPRMPQKNLREFNSRVPGGSDDGGINHNCFFFSEKWNYRKASILCQFKALRQTLTFHAKETILFRDGAFKSFFFIQIKGLG
jgi:hypothetical protein